MDVDLANKNWISEEDIALFAQGCHYELYKVLGARRKTHEGVSGVLFALWAPNAKEVCLLASGKRFSLRNVKSSGTWELFVPGMDIGQKYRFAILSKNGSLLIKSDPFAFYSELRPKTGSIVADVDTFAWTDSAWIQKRKSLSLNRPMNIYEVHLGSWKKGMNYREIAKELSAYCSNMGFTHVELLPITEHPLDESWGYQVTGFFSVTSRFGSVSDFQFFVDHMHAVGIGVILDWVPAHFPIDDFSLHRFDGTALFEHEDLRKGFHPHWNTAIFDYGNKQVQNFLIVSVLFWLETMHVDGIRVDAVSSMLHLDYGRKKGEWEPNINGENHNLEAIAFLKRLNAVVHERVPGALMIAEEASAFKGVTETLGFDLKWNMGWMNDTLRYTSRSFEDRKNHQNELTFGMMYAFSERFVCPLSHDEVVHGKASLLSKMPGEKFAGARLLYSYMIAHPGKNLLFMGGEFGQWEEWNCVKELDWHLLQYPQHQGIQKMVRDLNHLYLEKSAFWERDFSWDGYEWVDFSDHDQSVISYLRKSSDSTLLVVHHFLPGSIQDYKINLKGVKKVVEIFNTDAGIYGGTGEQGHDPVIQSSHISVFVPSLATTIFEIE